MMKTAALFTALLVSLAATGCGKASLADDIRAAMPSAQAARVGAPEAGQAAPAPLMAGTAAPAAPRSGYAFTSWAYATSINLSVAALLWQLEAVTFWPPTSCTDAACTWGPGSDATDVNDFMLVVARSGEGFDYALQARPKSAPAAAWVPVIAGVAYPGATRASGHGHFAIDFDDVWARLDHKPSETAQKDFGQLQVSYDARSAVKVQAAFIAGKDAERFDADPTARADAFYDFAANGQGGSLQLAYRVHATSEAISLHTRWLAGGAGRGDVRYTGYQAPNGPVDMSECWDGAAGSYLMTFASSQAPAFGDEARCAFADQAVLPFPDPFPPSVN